MSDTQDLRALRKRLGSQTAVGKMLGLSRDTIGVYENERTPPPWYRLALERLLAEAEKTTPDLGGPGVTS